MAACRRRGAGRRWWALAALVLAPSVGAADVACPATLTVRQRATALAGGWQVGYDAAPALLAGATISEGPPSDGTPRLQDDERRSAEEWTLTWELAPSEKGYWLSCTYERTTARLSRRLPASVKHCEVVRDRGAVLRVKRARCR